MSADLKTLRYRCICAHFSLAVSVHPSYETNDTSRLAGALPVRLCGGARTPVGVLPLELQAEILCPHRASSRPKSGAAPADTLGETGYTVRSV